MLTVSQAFDAELRRRIQTRVAEVAENVANGTFSLEDYRRECGRIAGLREVLVLCDEVKDDLDKR